MIVAGAQVRITPTGANEFAAELKTKFGGAIKALGLGLGIGEIIKFGKESVKAFKESEDAQLKLEAAFAKFPQLAGENIKAFQAYNLELQKHTRFSDEDAARAEANLAQFKLTGDQIRELIPLVADFAARTGQDMTTASTSLGRALLGNTRALKQIGINFKATGNTAKDFDTIIGLLRGSVGGFAEKEGKTAAGQSEILKNQFNELQEIVGKKLLPILNTLARDGLAVISFLQTGAGKAALFAGGALFLASKIDKITTAVKGLSIASSGGLIAKILGTVGAPEIIAIAAGVGLIAAEVSHASTEALHANQGLSYLVTTLRDIAKVVPDNATGFDALVSKLRILKPDTESLNQVMILLNKEGLHDLDIKFHDAAVAAGLLPPAISDYAGEADAASTATGKLDGKLQDVTASFKDTTEAAGKFNDALNETLNPLLASQQADDDLIAKQRALEAIFRSGKDAFKGNSEEAIRNRNALVDLVTQIGVTIDKDAIAGKVTAGKTSELHHEKEALEAIATKHKELKPLIQGYIDQINIALGQGDINTHFTTPGLSVALTKTAKLSLLLKNFGAGVIGSFGGGVTPFGDGGGTPKGPNTTSSGFGGFSGGGVSPSPSPAPRGGISAGASVSGGSDGAAAPSTVMLHVDGRALAQVTIPHLRGRRMGRL